MANRRTRSARSSLEALIDDAQPDVLRDLVRSLVQTYPETRQICFDMLGGHLPDGSPAKADAAAAAARELWDKAEDMLDDLNAYGGGPDEDVDEVMSLLYDLEVRVPDLRREDRRDLLEACLPYIENDNSGLEDPLYDFAQACCPDAEDLRHFAQLLEGMGQEWPEANARRIYRQLRDSENFLRLRLRQMRFGSDYHDLATYYSEIGEPQKAFETARMGVEKAEGRMDELRAFYAEELRRSGDRAGAMELEFANLLSNLNVQSYESFREQCSRGEWERFEPRLVAALPGRRIDVRISLHMLRGEYEKAVRLLADVHYGKWVSAAVMTAAAGLEEQFPQEVLDFYRSGLGPMDHTAPRGEYAQWAHIVAKVRHMLVDVMHDRDAWAAFARTLKVHSQRRPAMNEEFSKVLPDWDAL